jgi:hypothetical protein
MLSNSAAITCLNATPNPLTNSPKDAPESTSRRVTDFVSSNHQKFPSSYQNPIAIWKLNNYTTSTGE